MGPEGLVRFLDREAAARLEFPESKDATGGISGKVDGALGIADAGTEVAFISGFDPPEISKALKGLSFHGTTVKVPSRDKERRSKRS
jgi:isopentenyl phosphate kinase